MVGGGVAGCCEPDPGGWSGGEGRGGAERGAYCSTEPRQSTLRDLIVSKLLNAGSPRLTVGAANVQTGEMHYFDSRETPLSIRHIMASGALPPAFPALRIAGQLSCYPRILSIPPLPPSFSATPLP